jgi:hypothetical protein
MSHQINNKNEDSSNPDAEAEEPITPDEFMRRIGIKKTTYFQWKKSGRLIRVRHYVQAGGKIIIFWSLRLLRELDDLYQEDPKEEHLIENGAPISTPKTPRRRCAINLNY